MQIPLTPSEVIQYTKIATYLSADDNAKGSLFSPTVTPYLPIILFSENFILEWYSNISGNDSITLQQFANYVWSLDGMYGVLAIGVATGGGGSITPGTPGIRPARTTFVVSGSSIIPTGSSTANFPNYIGYNIAFTRDAVPQTQIDTGGQYFSWDSATGDFECFGVANVDELFDILPV